MGLDESTAREILGVSSSASFKEIKKAHRSLVNIFHPDRAASDAESQRKATESMSRINLAWSVIEERHSSGLLGKKEHPSTSTSDYSTWKFTPRRPGRGECGICGSAPAEMMTLKGIAVLLIGIAWPGYQGTLCKSCATAFAREALRTSMVRGWWGLWFFITPFVIAYLSIRLVKISRMKDPTYRDFRVITPYEMPVSAGPNPFRDVKALGAMTGGIITVIFALIVGANGSNDSANYNNQSPPVAMNCWTSPDANNQLKNVACSDSLAVYQTLGTTLDSSTCPLGTVEELDKNANGEYTCLGNKA